ncbi:MAG: patatin-like phospholipase family protein, partial [Lachnospiraceae bacterium]|nr:patatin-like phospholipase family protein [Lachnospiraceae bacterium]
MIAYGTIEEKWGLCLAGGGGKGAYEIGVWKALAEEDSIKFKAVSGASVGALNAALFATMQVSEAEEIWKKIKPDVLLSPQKEAMVDLIKIFAYKNLAIKTLPIFRIPVEINIGDKY